MQTIRSKIFTTISLPPCVDSAATGAAAAKSRCRGRGGIEKGRGRGVCVCVGGEESSRAPDARNGRDQAAETHKPIRLPRLSAYDLQSPTSPPPRRRPRIPASSRPLPPLSHFCSLCFRIPLENTYISLSLSLFGSRSRDIYLSFTVVVFYRRLINPLPLRRRLEILSPKIVARGTLGARARFNKNVRRGDN